MIKQRGLGWPARPALAVASVWLVACVVDDRDPEALGTQGLAGASASGDGAAVGVTLAPGEALPPGQVVNGDEGGAMPSGLDPAGQSAIAASASGVPCTPGAAGCACDAGGACALGLVCDTNLCRSPDCGDGRTDDGEACDDGDGDDTNGCTRACALAVCGDGFVQAGVEECDDGNDVDTDSCTTGCKSARCGDGVVQGAELCDTGATSNNGPCRVDCTPASCGDGFVQDGVETCDDGNDVDTDSCSNGCRSASCGDGVTQAPEECDDGNESSTDTCTSSCRLARCGDGFVQGIEQCDDGNSSDADACTSTCQLARCGDGSVQGTEQCDDGNSTSTDACTSTCQRARCGDGFVQGIEQCDDGNSSNTDACINTCQRARCGDGFVQATEECDDGNGADGDSCSNQCSKRYNVAFVTSTVHTVATLGGVAGADSICRQRADAAGLDGDFVAWISDSQSSAFSRIGAARGWVRVDGLPFMDEIRGQLTYYPPSLTEQGAAVTDSPIGLGGYGEPTDNECNDWTGGAGFILTGDPTAGFGGWIGSVGGTACSASFRLYCFQRDFVSPLTFARASGRRAFVTNEPWLPGGGLADADARCAADARAAGLSGSYRALLGTTTASAASRFSSAGSPWVRLDGIPLVARAADLFDPAGTLLAPLQITASGTYLTNYGGWTGGADPRSAGTTASTCNNWASSTGTAVGGRVLFGRLSKAYAFDTALACSAGFTHLYCLEQ